jgi:hypothetical protein
MSVVTLSVTNKPFMLSVFMLSVFMLSVFMLSVFMLSVFMLSVFMLSVFMLIVVILSVVILNVVATYESLKKRLKSQFISATRLKMFKTTLARRLRHPAELIKILRCLYLFSHPFSTSVKAFLSICQFSFFTSQGAFTRAV